METYGLTARPRNAKRRRGAGLDDNYHDREGNLSDDADKEFAQEDDDDEDDFERRRMKMNRGVKIKGGAFCVVGIE